MARLKIVDEAQADTFYSDLAKGLGNRDELVIGHNTKLVRLKCGCIGIRLYSTNVVTVWPDNYVMYQTGGYLTVTTIDRINRVANKFNQVASRAGGKLNIYSVRSGC